MAVLSTARVLEDAAKEHAERGVSVADVQRLWLSFTHFLEFVLLQGRGVDVPGVFTLSAGRFELDQEKFCVALTNAAPKGVPLGGARPRPRTRPVVGATREARCPLLAHSKSGATAGARPARPAAAARRARWLRQD